MVEMIFSALGIALGDNHGPEEPRYSPSKDAAHGPAAAVTHAATECEVDSR